MRIRHRVFGSLNPDGRCLSISDWDFHRFALGIPKGLLSYYSDDTLLENVSSAQLSFALGWDSETRSAEFESQRRLARP